MSTISASTTSTTAFKITTDTTGALVFQTGSSPTTAVTFDGSQNVGVGATPSAWKSNYKAVQFGNGGNLVGRTDTNALYLSTNWYVNSSNQDIYTANGYAALYSQNTSGQHVWYTAGSGTAGGTISFTQAVTLSASGFLGIGQTSPTYSVDILADTGNLLVHQTRARVIDAERNLGGIAGGGYSTGTTVVDAAQIVLASTGAWTSTSTPSYIAFSTTPSGSSTPAEAARINSNANFVLKGGTTSASGVGVTFPATQSASSDANCLDDYEEGTWTPTINLLGTVTYSSRFGKYQKIGKYVRVAFALYMSSTDTTQDSSAMLIGGLPFTVTNALGSDYENGSACLLTERMRATSSPAAANTFHVLGSIGNTSLVVVQNNYNGTIGNASYFASNGRSGYFGGTMYVLGQFTYETSA